MNRPIYLSKHINLLFLIGLGLSFCSLNTVFVSALTYQTTTDVEFTVNPSINVSLSSNDLLISDLTPGTSSDSNIITVNVSTNAGYGYYLAATAGTSSGSTNLVNTVDSSRVFTNLSSNKASLSNFSDNTWGYSYSTDNGTSWISGNNDAATAGYNGLPLDNNDNGATGIKLASTDSYVSTNSIKFKIGAKASTTQSGGTYTNTVNFYAVANPEPTLGPVACEAGRICYNANSLTAVEGVMGQQSVSSNSSVTLYASNYSREGYGFAGWNTTYDYSGLFYGPNQTITTPTDMSAGLPLYAVWVRSAGSMQSNATSVCNSLTAAPTNGTANLSSVSALTDERDGQVYAIAKLADGNCWMIENLRLENTNSDNSTGVLAQGYESTATLGSFVGLANSETFDFSTSSANSIYYYRNQSGSAFMDISTTGTPLQRMPRYNNENTQSRQDSTNYDPSNATYSFGNYYTWPAAIASTNAYETSYEIVRNTSICPLGWKLPYGGNVQDSMASGGFYYLSLQLGDSSAKWREFPGNFIYSGVYYGPNPDYRNEDGFYWSSTFWSNGSYPYSLDLSSSTAYVNSNVTAKYNGASIRCVGDF